MTADREITAVQRDPERRIRSWCARHPGYVLEADAPRPGMWQFLSPRGGGEVLTDLEDLAAKADRLEELEAVSQPALDRVDPRT